jgi:general stress protein CsbA
MSTPPTPASPQAARFCQVFAWTLALIVAAAAVVTWGQTYQWHLLPINNYVLFPLFGLLAFSIMWSHYVAGAVRELLKLDTSALKSYFEGTSFVVLALICLHPGVLIYQRFRDGFGLPPHSYETYVAPGLGWVTLLGTLSLGIFLAYEFRRKYGRRPWWHHMQELTDVAMLAIFYHALRLGHQIVGWFRVVWWFYGIVLVVILIRTYAGKYIAHKKDPAM